MNWSELHELIIRIYISHERTHFKYLLPYSVSNVYTWIEDAIESYIGT
jgi:hypothetical protein